MNQSDPDKRKRMLNEALLLKGSPLDERVRWLLQAFREDSSRTEILELMVKHPPARRWIANLIERPCDEYHSFHNWWFTDFKEYIRADLVEKFSDDIGKLSSSESIPPARKEHTLTCIDNYDFAVDLLGRLLCVSDEKKDLMTSIGELILDGRLTERDSKRFLYRMIHQPREDEPNKTVMQIRKLKPALRKMIDYKFSTELDRSIEGTVNESLLGLARRYFEQSESVPNMILKLDKIYSQTNNSSVKLKVLKAYESAIRNIRLNAREVELVAKSAISALDISNDSAISELLSNCLDSHKGLVLDRLKTLSSENIDDKIELLYKLAVDKNIAEFNNIIGEHLTAYINLQSRGLFDESKSKRYSAISNILKFNNETNCISGEVTRKVLDVLIEDTDETMRADAAKLLGYMGAVQPEKIISIPNGVHYLVENLDDKSYDVRANAAEAIGKIGKLQPAAVTEAIPRLSNAKESQSNFNVRSIEALSNIAETNSSIVAPYLEDIVTVVDEQYTRTQKDRSSSSEKDRMKSILESTVHILGHLCDSRVDTLISKVARIIPTIEKYHVEFEQNGLNEALAEIRLRITDRLPPSPSTIIRATEVKKEDKVEEETGKTTVVCENPVEVGTAISYKGGTVVYKVKVENKTSYGVCDLSILPLMGDEDLFRLDIGLGRISMLKPGEAKSVTFTLRPTGQCGNIDINSQVTYYDLSKNDHYTIKSEPRKTKIVCPTIKSVSLEEKIWGDTTEKLLVYSEDTAPLQIPYEILSNKISESIRSLNMCLVSSRTESINEYEKKCTQKYYGEGSVKGTAYAAEVEILGTGEKSRVSIKAFTANEESLVGFYHGLIDAINKEVKELKDRITINNVYNINVKDSVVLRSSLIPEKGNVCVDNSLVLKSEVPVK